MDGVALSICLSCLAYELNYYDIFAVAVLVAVAADVDVDDSLVIWWWLWPYGGCC